MVDKPSDFSYINETSRVGNLQTPAHRAGRLSSHTNGRRRLTAISCGHLRHRTDFPSGGLAGAFRWEIAVISCAAHGFVRVLLSREK